MSGVTMAARMRRAGQLPERGRRPAAPPTTEQLLILADRAERGPLTPVEAARLRQGISVLAAFARAVGHREAPGA